VPKTFRHRRDDRVVRGLRPGPGGNSGRGRVASATCGCRESGTVSEHGDITKDRNPESTKTFPGVVKLTNADGSPKDIPVQISARGNLRRSRCDFIPLRIDFPKPESKGTVFEMRAAGLKMVTHCAGSRDYEQYILKEYLAYRIGNIVTPRSFRARLAKVTYVDSESHKTRNTRYAIFLEDDDDVARRLEGKIEDRKNVPFSQLHPVALTQMMIFQFMIGNTDFSIMALHNMRLVTTPVGLNYPIPYDFDISGFVNAPYGAPDPRLRLKALTERRYRGPCHTAERLAPMLDTFRSKKLEVIGAVESQPDLTPMVRNEAKKFLADFYSLIDRPTAVKLFLVQPCIKGGV
jgi:hypothetical protein